MTREGRKIWFHGATVIVLLAGVWFIQWNVQAKGDQLRSHYLNQTIMLSETLEPSRLDNLHGTPEDLNSPEYYRLKYQLQSVTGLYSEAAHIYLLGWDEEQQPFYPRGGNAPRRREGARTRSVVSESLT